MPEAVRVIFVAEGQQSVLNAFASIQKKSAEVARFQAVEAQRGTKAATKAANDNIKAIEQSSKQAEKLALIRQQAETKIALDGARSRNKILVDGSKAGHQAQLAQVKASLAAKRDEVREFQRAEREKTRATEQESQRRQQAEAAAARAAQRSTSRGSRNGSAGLLSGAIGRGARGAWGTVTGLGAGLGLAGGTMMIGDAVQEGLQVDRQAALLANAVTMPGFAPPDPKELAAQARGLAGKTGFKGTDVMEAMETVSARAQGAPGLQAFQKDIDDISKTAIAAGVKIQDLGAVYAAAFNAGVKPGEEMKQIIRDFVMMGKSGQVEFKDLADELARLGGAGLSFGSKGDMLRTVVGMAQIGAKAHISPEQSRTAVIDTFRDLSTNAHTLRKAGVNVFDKTGASQRNPLELLPEVIDTLMSKGVHHRGKGIVKGGEALSSVFTGTSHPFAQLLAKEYTDKGGGKSGQAAVRKMLEDAMAQNAPKMTGAQRDTEYQRVMDTDAQKWDVAVEQFKNKISELLPRITALMPVLTDLMEKLAKFAVWAADNPFKALGVLLVGSVTKEIAAAGLGEAIKSTLLRLLGGGGGSPVPGAGAGGLGGTVGGALGVGALAVAGGYALGSAVAADIDESAPEGRKVMDAKYRGLEFASYYRNKAKKEGLTDEERQQVVKQAQVMTQWGERAKQNETISGWDVINPDAYANREGYRAGGGDYAKPEAFAEVAKAMLEIAANAKKASGELSRVTAPTTPKMSNPGNSARLGTPAARTGLEH